MASKNIYKIYEDEDFTAADSPVELDIFTDLTTLADNGRNQYGNSVSIYNTGKYDINLEVSMDGSTYGDVQTLKAKSIDNLTSSGIKKIRLTHTGNDSGYQVKAYSRSVGDNNLMAGGTEVFVQDNDTEPVDLYFHNVLSTFTIATNTTASGLTQGALNYDFIATTGHSITSGAEIILKDTDNLLFGEVMTVSGDTITLDRPIDKIYVASTTTGEIVTTNMNVDGSSTEQIFNIEAGATPIFIRRFIVTMTQASPATMDDGKFGGITALTRGCVFRIVNSFQKTILNIKNNGDFAQWSYDTTYTDNAPQGQTGFRCRTTFGGADKHGVILEIKDDDELQWIVQDDLTSLTTLKISVQGNKK